MRAVFWKNRKRGEAGGSEFSFFLAGIREDSSLLVKTTTDKSIKASPLVFRTMGTAVPVRQRSV